MAEEEPDWPPGPEALRIPFMFVLHGVEPPADWLAAHPDAIRFAATFVPRTGATAGTDENFRWKESQQSEFGAVLKNQRSRNRTDGHDDFYAARPALKAIHVDRKQ